MTCRKALGSAFILPLIFACVAAPAFGRAADIVPHQATYTLSMGDVTSYAKYNGVSGAAVSALERTCEGWSIDEQLVMTLFTADGGTLERETTYKARESLDGRHFYFNNKILTNGVPEETEGNAKRDQKGVSEVEYVVPTPREAPLPHGTQFYVGTMKWLIDLAKSGARTGHAYGFDGSDDTGARQIAVFILPDKGGTLATGDQTLLKAKAWRAQVAYFLTEGKAAEPDLEMNVRFLENGVVTRFEVNVGGIVVNQVLEDVVPTPEKRCN